MKCKKHCSCYEKFTRSTEGFLQKKQTKLTQKKKGHKQLKKRGKKEKYASRN